MGKFACSLEKEDQMEVKMDLLEGEMRESKVLYDGVLEIVDFWSEKQLTCQVLRSLVCVNQDNSQCDLSNLTHKIC